MKCINCKHIDLKASPKHSNVGFAPCKLLKDMGVFVSLTHDRECEKYEQASAAIILKRISWWDQLQLLK